VDSVTDLKSENLVVMYENKQIFSELFNFDEDCGQGLPNKNISQKYICRLCYSVDTGCKRIKAELAKGYIAFRSHVEKKHENNWKKEMALRLLSGPMRGPMDL